MTYEQAFAFAVFRGLVPTAAITAELVARWPWWSERCELVLVATEALAELGRPRTRLELGKCLLAEGYSFAEAAEVVVEVVPPAIDFDALERARRWLLEQMQVAS